MKRSFLTVAATITAIAVGACGPAETDRDIEPVEEVQPAPAPMPEPPPAPLPEDTLPLDTLPEDTLPGM